MEKNMKLLKVAFSTLYFLLIITNLAKAENYIFGGAKVFNYGVEKSDLQNVNTSLVNLGFSSSTSSTDNRGYGFDLGVGFGISDNLSIETGYVNYGTLTINTRTTGPVENIKTEISGSGLTFAGRYTDDTGLFVRGGMHSWDLTGKVSTSLGSSSEPLGEGTDPFFSVGYKTPGAEGWNIGYDHYVIDDGDIGSITFGYTSSF